MSFFAHTINPDIGTIKNDKGNQKPVIFQKVGDRGNKHVHMHGEMLVKEENPTNFQGVKAIDLDILLIYNKHVHNIARDIYALFCGRQDN